MASPAASNLALTGIATSPGLPILCINRERGVREEEPSKEGMWQRGIGTLKDQVPGGSHLCPLYCKNGIDKAVHGDD